MQIAISIPGSPQASAPGAAGLAELAGLPTGAGDGLDGLGADAAIQTDAQSGFAEALAGALFAQTQGLAAAQPPAPGSADAPAPAPAPAPAIPLSPALQMLAAEPAGPPPAPDAAQAAPAAPGQAQTPAGAITAEAAQTFESLLSQLKGAKSDAAEAKAPPAQAKADAPAATPRPMAAGLPETPPVAPAPQAATTAAAAAAAAATPTGPAEQAAAAAAPPVAAPAGEKPALRGAARADAARHHGRPDVRGEGSPDNAVAQAASGKSGAPVEAARRIGSEAPVQAIDAEAPGAKTDVAEGQDQPAPAPLPAATAAAPQTQGAPKAEPATFVHLASQMVQKLAGKITRFDLELMPHGLGKVDVRIEISASGALSAALSFDSPQAAAELRGRADELKTALQQAGFNLTDNGLSFDLSGGQQRWAEDRRDDARAFAGRAFAAASDAADDILATTVAEAAARLQRRVADGGLDIRI